MRRTALVLAAAVVALASRAALDPSARPVLPQTRTPLPAELRIAALSFDSLASDILWIRFIQSLPNRAAEIDEGRILAQQLRAVVDLDPRFHSAYAKGSVLLNVLGNRPCDALTILERGIQEFPDDWQLRFQAGFICFVDLSDPGCAADHLEHAARAPHAPGWLPGLVGRLLAQSNRAKAAVDYLRFELARTTNPRLRERFEERLKHAQLTVDIERIEAAVREWRLSHPEETLPSLESLVDAGLLAPLPDRDPFGGRYVLTPDGRARSSTGRGGLRAHELDTPFYDTVAEKVTDERVGARLPRLLGKPYFIRSPLDGLATRAGRLEQTAQALETLSALGADPERERELLGLKARLILRADVEALESAYLRLLRRDPARRWTIEEIAAEAGVREVDPFGDPYELGDRGAPRQNVRRRPLAAVSERNGAARACR